MQSSQEIVRQFPPLVFHYSLDWRFLLPLSSPEKTFVFFETDPDFGQTLERVGIPVTNQLSFLDLQQIEKTEGASFVLPFGVPLRWVGKEADDQVEFFRSLGKMLGDFGNLLVGFNGRWNESAEDSPKYYTSTPRRMTLQLQKAGFKAIRIFGVIPDLAIPEYIFDLHNAPMGFALQHRFKRKPLALTLLQLLSRTIGTRQLSAFVPCYFVTATS